MHLPWLLAVGMSGVTSQIAETKLCHQRHQQSINLTRRV
jgi:hypothetical protein